MADHTTTRVVDQATTVSLKGQTSSESLLPAGTILGDHRIDGVLGEGSFSVVYEGSHLESNSKAAIKVLRLQWIHDDRIAQRFLLEARVCQELDHPAIVKVIGMGTAESGAPYLVMEFLEGISLQEMLDAEGPLPLPRTASLVSLLGAAFDAAHQHQVIHRDIKPSNILMSGPDRDQAVILDFGIAKIAGEGSDLTRSQEVVGSPICISPEQILGKEITNRTDVYGLAALAYHTLTARPVFDAPDLPTLYDHHIYAKRPSVAQRMGVPAGIDAVLAKALDPVPDKRFATTGEFAAAFCDAVGLNSADAEEGQGFLLGIACGVDLEVQETCEAELLDQLFETIDTITLEAVALCREQGLVLIHDDPGLAVLGVPKGSAVDLLALAGKLEAKFGAVNNHIQFGVALHSCLISYDGKRPTEGEATVPEAWLPELFQGIAATEKALDKLGREGKELDLLPLLYRIE